MTKRSSITPSNAERLAGFYRPVGNGGIVEMFFNYLTDPDISMTREEEETALKMWGEVLRVTREGA